MDQFSKEEPVVVSNRFHLKPLIPLLTEEQGEPTILHFTLLSS